MLPKSGPAFDIGSAGDADDPLDALHDAYVEAIRLHRDLMRDLDRTMRLAADAIDGKPDAEAMRSELTLALDGHIGRARAALARMDRTLTLAQGAPAVLN